MVKKKRPREHIIADLNIFKRRGARSKRRGTQSLLIEDSLRINEMLKICFAPKVNGYYCFRRI